MIVIAANAGGAWTPIGKGRKGSWTELKREVREDGRK